MRVVYFGTGDYGIASLEALRGSSHQLISVITRADKPQGRDLKIKSSPVKEWAMNYHQPLLDIADIHATPSMAMLRSLEADIFVVIAFGALLSEELLAMPRLGAINVHASLLPRWRGAAPIHRCLMSGDKKTGVSIIRMTKKLDAGDILCQRETPIAEQDDIRSLKQRLSLLGAELLIKGLDQIKNGRAVYKPQEESGCTYAAKLTKQDGKMDWTKTARQLHDQIRAIRDWPRAFTFLHGKRLIVFESAILSERGEAAAPGTVLSRDADGITVACALGCLKLLVLQAEGKKALSAAEFIHGHAINLGDRFE